jgi:Fe-S-cluster-containing dehydrogenase component/DMSO reductase anchor subunit
MFPSMIKVNPEMIQDFIEQQQSLTAVERFTQQKEARLLSKEQPRYQELIPKTTPGPGQQYAFEVDLDRCTGCKGCVTACHSENGLDEDETWRSVGLVHGETAEGPMIQHVTTACHHCLEPACMAGCPTKAYEKDPKTGIVRHLDDQCFGCQYCILKCPYDVPKYNKKKGIVHKCDMCHSRLKVGEAPACVRGCPNEAIRITLIDKDQVRIRPQDYVQVPDAPDSRYTLPTTQYKRKDPFPGNAASSDLYAVEPEHAHMPLVIMLVLTQLSVGAFLAEFILKSAMHDILRDLFRPFHVMTALSLGMVALAASIFHLGRPQYAFRAVLGLKTSWLSREIVAFGMFAFTASFYAVLIWFPPLKGFLKDVWGVMAFEQSSYIMAALVFLFGTFGILCSVMVYKDTRRPYWDNPFTTIKFYLTMGILGFATILFSSTMLAVFQPQITMTETFYHFWYNCCLIICVTSILKMSVEAGSFFHLNEREMTILKKTAILMVGPLKSVTIRRFALGILGGVFLPLLLIAVSANTGAVGFALMTFLILAGTLLGELHERYLFFTAVVPLKMPGGKV